MTASETLPTYTVAAAFCFWALLISSPAHAYWYCDGMLTSNNSCIGSLSNVDSSNNHEPIDTNRRDYIIPEVNGRDGYRNSNERDRDRGSRRGVSHARPN